MSKLKALIQQLQHFMVCVIQISIGGNSTMGVKRNNEIYLDRVAQNSQGVINLRGIEFQKKLCAASVEK